jgi:DNA-binding NtrC family response regulator
LSTPKTILIVEDHEDLLLLYKISLRSEAYRILTATTVAAALASLQDEVVHCVLADIGLPDGDGFDLLRSIKELYPSLPVVFMTAARNWTREDAIAAGAIDLFNKPLPVGEVKALLHKIL